MRARIGISLCLATLFALLPLGAGAENGTVIHAVVPSSHTLTIDCGEHGGVSLEEAQYRGSFQLSVPRQGGVSFTATPDEGYVVSEIGVDSPNGVTLSGMTLTLGAVCRDRGVSVRFAPSESETGLRWNEGDDMPEMPPLGNRLYDEMLGTGGGLGELFIIHDALGAPKDYWLLELPKGETPEADSAAEVIIEAKPTLTEAEDQTRVLSLSCAQLLRMQTQGGVERLSFLHADAVASLNLSEALTGDVGKLIALMSRGEIADQDAEALRRTLDAMPEAEPSWNELAETTIETRIEPTAPGAPQAGVRIGVWLKRGANEIDISPFVPSMEVRLMADGMLDPQESEAFAAAHTVALQSDGAAEATPLESTLRRLVETEQGDTEGVARFDVSYSEAQAAPVSLSIQNASSDALGRYALCARYAGPGLYFIAPIIAS